MELGGSVSITCAKTGYGASIEFLTKPFYGGKKNRVTAELLQPDRKVFGTISGEWNGAMTVKWLDGVCTTPYYPIKNLNQSFRFMKKKKSSMITNATDLNSRKRKTLSTSTLYL